MESIRVHWNWFETFEIWWNPLESVETRRTTSLNVWLEWMAPFKPQSQCIKLKDTEDGSEELVCLATSLASSFASLTLKASLIRIKSTPLFTIRTFEFRMFRIQNIETLFESIHRRSTWIADLWITNTRNESVWMWTFAKPWRSSSVRTIRKWFGFNLS